MDQSSIRWLPDFHPVAAPNHRIRELVCEVLFPFDLDAIVGLFDKLRIPSFMRWRDPNLLVWVEAVTRPDCREKVGVACDKYHGFAHIQCEQFQ